MGGSPNSLVLRASESCNVTQGMCILPPILVIGSVERVLEFIVGAESPHLFQMLAIQAAQLLEAEFGLLTPF